MKITSPSNSMQHKYYENKYINKKRKTEETEEKKAKEDTVCISSEAMELYKLKCMKKEG